MSQQRVAEAFGVSLKNGFLIGCEFEVEGIAHFDQTWLNTHGVAMTEDPSLRQYQGRAYEFITKPITQEKAVEIHDNLYNKGKLEFAGDPTSDRCSIHVHVNFSDLTMAKTRQFILLYALLEPLFFQMTDETRQNNIYCVPLSFTPLNKYYPYENLGMLVERWSKYTAFNLLPLGKQGSIEFRHLQGTANNAVFAGWVEAIHRLYKVNNQVLLHPGFDQEMIEAIAQKVFGNILPASELSGNTLLKKLENTYLDVKLALLDPCKDLVIERIKAANMEPTI
jgi:hypothetical protein